METERVERRRESPRWRWGHKKRERGEQMRDIKTQTVNVREIKKIVVTER